MNDLDTRCEECGLSIQVRLIHDRDATITLDAYRRPARDGMTWILRHDGTVTTRHRFPEGYMRHDETCPAKDDEA